MDFQPSTMDFQWFTTDFPTLTMDFQWFTTDFQPFTTAGGLRMKQALACYNLQTIPNNHQQTSKHLQQASHRSNLLRRTSKPNIIATMLYLRCNINSRDVSPYVPTRIINYFQLLSITKPCPSGLLACSRQAIVMADEVVILASATDGRSSKFIKKPQLLTEAFLVQRMLSKNLSVLSR